jgi:hypothetical protein
LLLCSRYLVFWELETMVSWLVLEVVRGWLRWVYSIGATAAMHGNGVSLGRAIAVSEQGPGNWHAWRARQICVKPCMEGGEFRVMSCPLQRLASIGVVSNGQRASIAH